MVDGQFAGTVTEQSAHSRLQRRQLIRRGFQCADAGPLPFGGVGVIRGDGQLRIGVGGRYRRPRRGGSDRPGSTTRDCGCAGNHGRGAGRIRAHRAVALIAEISGGWRGHPANRQHHHRQHAAATPITNNNTHTQAGIIARTMRRLIIECPSSVLHVYRIAAERRSCAADARQIYLGRIATPVSASVDPPSRPSLGHNRRGLDGDSLQATAVNSTVFAGRERPTGRNRWRRRPLV